MRAPERAPIPAGARARPPRCPTTSPDTVAELRAIADELNALLAQHNPPGDDKAIPSIVAIGEWVTELEAQDLLTQERMLIGGFPKAYASSGTAGNWGAGKVQIKALRERYWELVTETSLRLRSNALLGLLPHVESFVEGYETAAPAGGPRRVRRPPVLGARPAARPARAARNYFRGRFRAVLIDEFQDTDPVQAELALLLTSLQEPDGDWRATDARSPVG